MKKGPSIRSTLFVTLEDVYNGKTLEVDMNKQVICTTCRGTGAKDSNDIKTCTSCNGKGIKVVRQMLAPGIYQQMQVLCDACGGKGKVVKSTCPSCAGKKVRRGSSQFTVMVEHGMDTGDDIVFEREGDQSPDITPGDMIFELEVMPHPMYERKGNHLYFVETITLKESLLGFSHEIPHLDGTNWSLNREGPIQPGILFFLNLF
jgi:DnaJ-related protein SCJ1